VLTKIFGPKDRALQAVADVKLLKAVDHRGVKLKRLRTGASLDTKRQWIEFKLTGLDFFSGGVQKQVKNAAVCLASMESLDSERYDGQGADRP